VGGEYAYRVRGEAHAWTPATISKLQHATRSNSRELFDEFCSLIDEQNETLLTLRGLMSFNDDADPIPLDEVEPAAAIVKRFATGAMWFDFLRGAHQPSYCHEPYRRQIEYG
jgi:glutamate synthase (NADPH) large chain